MSYHLSRKHGKKASSESKRRRKYSGKDLLLRAIIKSKIPFTFVENDFFKEYLDFYGVPHCDQPSRQWISSSIEEQARKVEKKLITELKEVEFVSLSIDCWTSRTCDHYLGVVIHYIKEWKLHTTLLRPKVLSFLQNDEIQTSTKTLISEIPRLLERYGLSDKLVTITTDKGPDILSSLNQLGLKKHWYPCFNHVLNRCFVVAFDSNKYTAIEKLRKLVVHMKKSIKGREVCPVNLKTFSQTRWTSTILVLQRFLMYTDEIHSALIKMQDHTFILSDGEILVLKEVFHGLCRLQPIIKQCQEEDRPETGFTIPWLFSFRNFLSTFIQNKVITDEAKTILEVFLQALDERFKVIYPCQAICCCLHPATKSYLKNPVVAGKSDDIKEILSKEYQVLKSQNLNDSTDSLTSQMIQSDYAIPDLNTQFPSIYAEETAVEDELNHYLSRDFDIPSDILLFWKNHRKQYPILSKLAKKYFSSAASGASIERRWNSGSYIDAPRRSRLSATNMECLIFLDWNMQYLSEEVETK